MAAGMVEAEDILGDVRADVSMIEQRKFDLALNLAEQYMRLVSHWQWGDSILEWVRQCEITFEACEALRSLLHPDVVAPCRPQQLRQPADGKIGADARRRSGERRRPAPHVPPAAAHRLLLQPVSVLSECQRYQHRLPYLGASRARFTRVVSARPLPFRGSGSALTPRPSQRASSRRSNHRGDSPTSRARTRSGIRRKLPLRSTAALATAPRARTRD